MMVPMTRNQVSVVLSSLFETIEIERNALAESQSRIDHSVRDWLIPRELTKEETIEISSELATYHDDLMAVAETEYMIRVLQTLLMRDEAAE